MDLLYLEILTQYEEYFEKIDLWEILNYLLFQEMFSRARKRIVIASLYLGTGHMEKEMVISSL